MVLAVSALVVASLVFKLWAFRGLSYERSQ